MRHSNNIIFIIINNFYYNIALSLHYRVSINQQKNSTNCVNNIGKQIQVLGNGSIYICLSENQSVEFSSSSSEDNYILETSKIKSIIFTNTQEFPLKLLKYYNI